MPTQGKPCRPHHHRDRWDRDRLFTGGGGNFLAGRKAFIQHPVLLSQTLTDCNIAAKLVQDRVLLGSGETLKKG